jgi:hypothetical protein
VATNDGHIPFGDGTGNFTSEAGTQFPIGVALLTDDFNPDGKADLALTNGADQHPHDLFERERDSDPQVPGYLFKTPAWVKQERR